MYLLDTNVISELRKIKSARTDAHVKSWALRSDARQHYLSVISILEIELGINSLSRHDGVQAGIIRSWLAQVLAEFNGRILPIDLATARRCAALHVPDPKSERDAFIAATALVYGLTVVTRNTDDFVRTGVALLNPWIEQRL
jgi:predicted nucleic acid-binding protein